MSTDMCTQVAGVWLPDWLPIGPRSWAALVSVDPDGEVTVDETGDHLGRKGLKIGAGVGLVVGLLAPPLLASVVVGGAAGALVGKFAKHKVESGLGEKLGAALPPGTAGIVAIYDRAKGRHRRPNPRQRRQEIRRRGRRPRRQTTQGRPRRSASRYGRRLNQTPSG